MGAAWILALIIVSTLCGLGLRELWHDYKEADRAFKQAEADKRFAREHRFHL